MGTIDSSEGITKFLRSKNNPLDKIILTANSLLSDEIPVYLPNKTLFLFELVCDRLNDSSPQFKDWKFNECIWKLAIRLWKLLGLDIESEEQRNKIVKRVRHLDLLISILDKRDIQELVLEKALDFFGMISQTIYIRMDENYSIALVSSYVNNPAILKNKYNNHEWSSFVKRFFNLGYNSNDDKSNKKNIAKFFKECLASILNFITISGEKNATSTILKDIMTSVVFDKKNLPSFEKNFDDFLSTSLVPPSNDAIVYFFKLSTKRLTGKDYDKCEQLYMSITSNNRFGHLSLSLIEELANSKKVLSKAFLFSVYTNEMAKAPSSRDWNLINLLLQLSSILTLERTNEILKSFTDIPDKTAKLQIADTIIDAYINARDSLVFFQKVFPQATEVNDLWSSNDLIQLIATKVNSLTVKEINAILESPLEKKELKTITTSMLRGVLTSSAQKKSGLKDILLTKSKLFDDSWEIPYYILCIYGGETTDYVNNIVQLLESRSDLSEYYYKSLFRVMELTGEKLKVKNFQESFPKFFASIEQEQFSFISRWVVILNTFLEKQELFDILDKALLSKEVSAVIDFISHSESILFEQKRVIHAIIVISISRLERGDQISALFQKIPIQCFEKKTKKRAMELLYNQALNADDLYERLESRKSLLHLLRLPSFNSTIESNFDAALSLLKSSEFASKEISKEVFKAVYNSKLQHSSVPEHRQYVVNSIESLLRYLKNYEEGQVTAELEVILIVLQSNGSSSISDNELKEQFISIQNQFIKSISHYMNESKSILDINFAVWFLKAMNFILETQATDLSMALEASKKISSRLGKDHIDEAKDFKLTIFSIYCKLLEPNFNHSVYLSALYICLKSEDQVSFTDSLVGYFSRFLQSNKLDYFEFFKYTFMSAESSFEGEEDIDNVADILLLLNFPFTKEHLNEATKYFLHSLSLILDQIDQLQDRTVLDLLDILRKFSTEKTWLFSQFTTEFLVTLATKVATRMSLNDSNRSRGVEIYNSTIKLVSSILLFHRYKLTSRHHVIIKLFVALLQPLVLTMTDSLSSDRSSAAAYSRLVTNLCEPSNLRVKDTARKNLNSFSALARKALRKHLPSLLVNYIYFSLRYRFSKEINEELLVGIYSILNVLSDRELNLVNVSLDNSGKMFFKTLYANYKSFGKWRLD